MQVTVRLVCGRFAESAVWGTAVVEDIAELLDDRWEEPLVDVARRKVRLTEVRVLIIVIQLEFERLCDLVVWTSVSASICPAGKHHKDLYLHCYPLETRVSLALT